MRVALVEIPFLNPNLSSLALTQIKARLKECCKDIEVDIYYANHFFYSYFGKTLYERIIKDSTYTLINDWIFRSEAFDNIDDNSSDYLKRFYPGKQNEEFRNLITEKKEKLGQMINEYIDEYKLDKYDLIGSSTNFTIVPGMAFFRNLKKRNPEISTVFGGAGVYKEKGIAIIKNYNYVDYVNSGPGLVSFPELVNAISDKDSEKVNNIEGIFTKNNFDKIGITGEELDINHPVPLDYDEYINSLERFDIRKDINPVLLAETSRGCYWRKCTFCGLCTDQYKYFYKRPEIAISETNELIEKYNLDIMMVDMAKPRTYTQKVIPFFNVPEDLSIIYEIRTDYNEDEIKILKKSNVDLIQPGVESLTTNILTIMDKGVNAFQSINFLKKCLENGIFTNWNIIIGFPGITPEMYEELFSIIKKLAHIIPPNVLTPVRFDRFSVYWNDPDKYELKLHPFSAYSYVFPYDMEFLNNFAYYFEDRNYTSDRLITMMGKYSDMDNAVKKWKENWSQENTDDIARLQILSKDDNYYIYDSRDNVKEYEISDTVKSILDYTNVVRSMDEIQLETGLDNIDIDKIINDLSEKDLLHREGDEVMSLIVRDYSNFDNMISKSKEKF